VKELPLYASEALSQGTFLCNTVLLSCNDYFVAILQFRKNSKAGSRVKSILYLCRRRSRPGCGDIEYLFFVVLPELEVIISHDAKEITEPVAGVSQGLTLVLGSSNGVSRVLALDFCRKCFVQRSVMKKSPGSNLGLTRRRGLRRGHLQKRDHLFDRRRLPHPAAGRRRQVIGPNNQIRNILIKLALKINKEIGIGEGGRSETDREGWTGR
jgi:hypothetical protein